MRYYGKDFWHVATLLRQQFPLSVPVVIETVPSAALTKTHGEPCYGDYAAMERDGVLVRYRIRIARGMAVGVAIDALIHEMSHCLDIDRNPNQPREHHRKSWGIAHSDCYRAVFG